MVDVDKLSDAELRTKLLEFGFPVMPITGTTRKVMTKKLKLLMENKNKIGSDTAGGRRSMGRYSSEEESDTDVKQTKKDKNRRATMAAPLMQPPSTTRARRSNSRLNDSDEQPPPRTSPKKEIKTSNVTTRTSRILKSSQDDFDTGSDSESDITAANYSSTSINNDIEYSRRSPIKSGTASSFISSYSTNKYSPPKTLESSFSRNISYSSSTAASPSRSTSSYAAPLTGLNASDYASERLNQIRSRLSLNNSTYDRPLPSYTSTSVKDNIEPEETPFLSNFTKRLSSLTVPKKDLDYKSDIKEYDSNGSSYNSVRSQLSSFRAAKGRETTYDYKNNQNSILKNNFVSFAVLAGAALFFIFLAIMYLGMRSDTSIVPADYKIPLCLKSDINHKKGVNCLMEYDVEDAINLLNVIKPELNKKAVANKCFDKTIRAHMTEKEIVTFCTSNFGIQEEGTVLKDLRNVQILTYFNPQWKIRVAQTPKEIHTVSESDATSNMEEVVFNRDNKTTNLVIFEPDLPWRCTMANTFCLIVKSAIFIIVVFGLLYAGNFLYKYYKHYVQKEKEEVGFMVERIIDILQTNSNEDKDGFVVVNHVRDMILPVADRKRKSKTWIKALKFINENESRVRTEIQEVHGEPYEVWRWISSSNLSFTSSPKNKSWQGQAFETQIGAVNSLTCSPTPCLKIRGMVEDGDRNTHTIREAVLGKCAHQCGILHCAVDSTSKCVYLKCADQNDAAVAYRNLHGWWYAGHLVTVKYLRLERYMQRFPDSPVNGPPFLKAISPSTDWAS